MPLDCTSGGPWLGSNPSPTSASSPAVSPSPAPTQTLARGSSFKPLHLASHPWVRAHLRAESRDLDKPRLSLLALYCHMHGPNSFSEPDDSHATTTPKPTPGIGAGLRVSPDSLLDTVVNGARPLAGRSTASSSARASPSSQATAFSQHCASGTMTLVPISVLPPFPRDAICRRTSNVRSPASSVSGTPGAPITTGQASTSPSLSKPRKRCQKQTCTAPLSVAAFPAAFNMLSSDDFFGHCAPEEKMEKRVEKNDSPETEDWVKKEVHKAQKKVRHSSMR